MAHALAPRPDGLAGDGAGRRAVALAWAAAKWIWGHHTPFFAPVSAIIALGTSYHERGRRALELSVR